VQQHDGRVGDDDGRLAVASVAEGRR
jgi:hypothetical protein